MKFCYSIVILILLTSCSDLKKSEQLEVLTNLASDVELIKDDMAGVNDTLVVYLDKIKLSNQYLKALYVNDTLSYSLASSIDVLVRLKNDFPQLINELTLIDSLLISKTLAIQKLDKDINNGSGDRSQYDDFLTSEKTDVKSIEDQIENLNERIELAILDFNMMYPGVNGYIQSIRVKE